MNPVTWLFETRGFALPGAGMGWSREMLLTNLVANMGLFAFLLTLGLLILSFQLRSPRRPRIFQDDLVANWFGAALLATALTFLVRGLVLFWPAYRLLVASNFFCAFIWWIAAVIAVPIAIRREADLVREERHAFANKVGVTDLKMTTNILRLERLQAEMKEQHLLLERMVREIEALPHLGPEDRP